MTILYKITFVRLSVVDFPPLLYIVFELQVTPDSIASQQLTPGDVIIMIEGEDARQLCHFDACDLVKHSGKSLKMTVRKATSTQ